jgi:hypothetical protein
LFFPAGVFDWLQQQRRLAGLVTQATTHVTHSFMFPATFSAGVSDWLQQQGQVVSLVCQVSNSH